MMGGRGRPRDKDEQYGFMSWRINRIGSNFLHAEYEVRDKLGKQSDMAWT